MLKAWQHWQRKKKRDNFVINCDTWTIFRWEDIFIRRITNDKRNENNHLDVVASSLLTLTSIERVQDKFCPRKINTARKHISAKANQQQKNHPWNLLPVQLVGFLNSQPLKYWNICSSSHVIILNTSIYFSVSKFLRWGGKKNARTWCWYETDSGWKGFRWSFSVKLCGNQSKVSHRHTLPLLMTLNWVIACIGALWGGGGGGGCVWGESKGLP